MSNHYRVGAYVSDGHAREPRGVRCKRGNNAWSHNPECSYQKPVSGPSVQHCTVSQCYGHCETDCICEQACWRGRAA